MQLKLPIVRSVLSVPAWALALAVLWPIVFFSFVLHSLAIGGDALNGKEEDGRYFLRKVSQSEADKTPYKEVSRAQYRANYVHGLALMILFVPCAVGICRIVLPALKQIRNPDAASPTAR